MNCLQFKNKIFVNQKRDRFVQQLLYLEMNCFKSLIKFDIIENVSLHKEQF
jgi:hypothetical protein